MRLSSETIRFLNTLENAIDPEVEDDYLKQWKNFTHHNFEGKIFHAVRKKKSMTDYHYQTIHINDALDNYESMLLSELQPNLKRIETGTGVLGVRCNYGTSILPSMFGAEIFRMPYETNTLPTSRPMGIDSLERLISNGIPNTDTGLGKRVFEMGEFYQEVFADYPKIRKYIPIYHPDAQGPLDLCEVLIGSEFFYLFYDDPDGMKELLRMITDTYKIFMDRWFVLFQNTSGFSTHWDSVVQRGNIVLRDDSAMNLSPDLYQEFGLPYDRELIDYYKGGVIHFCGRGDHYIHIMSGIPGLYGINMSQPHLNNMEIIFQNTVEKGIQILGFPDDPAKYQDREGAFFHNLSI